MAIGSFYDLNRDMYYGSQEEQFRRMQQMKEDEYRRMQMQAMAAQDPRLFYGNAQQAQITKQTPVLVDPNDPLAFLTKADKNLLLTGEMQ